MKARDAFDFCNDWRDTIYYSVAACLIAWLAYRGEYHHLCNRALDLVWFREFVRSVFWNNHKMNSSIASFISQSTILAQIMINPEIIAAHPIWVSFILLALSNTLFFSVRRAGHPKVILRSWWKNLFDCPRKQKPPQHRWEAAKRKMHDALEKFRPDFVPSPAYSTLTRSPS